MQNKSFLSLLLLLSILSIALSLMLGSTSISIAAVWNAIVTSNQTDNSTTLMIVSELRLPRALSSFAIGALLALAGLCRC